MDDLPPLVEAPRPSMLKLATPPPEELPYDFVPMRLLLVPGGLCVELNKPETLIGRHSEADVRLSMPDVSRRHCRFVFADGAWRVFDLNSLNGVYINGERLNDALVINGDRVRIGSLTFEVDLTKEAEQHVQRRVTDLVTLGGDKPQARKAS
jgi:pSer/pThr/pTyr-binding forkhead associated (FHA) protein